MKSEYAVCPIGKVSLKAQGDTAKGQFPPRNLIRAVQVDFKALYAGSKVRAGHAATIEQVNLVDMGDTDHRKRCINENFSASFFVCFTNCCLSRGFPVLHESGGKCPESESWFDGASAEQYPILPFDDATDYQAGIFIVDVSACITDVSRQRVSRWN